MADWRQIQARIRKAKAGADAPAKLAQLFEKTRDAMVAFELARLRENSGQNDEAVRWYTTAAERFRRADWKKKAEEALTRLGMPLPCSMELAGPAAPVEQAAERRGEPATVPFERAVAEAPELAPVPQAIPGRGKRRRRGRRGGRRRRRAKLAQAQLAPEAPHREPALARRRAEQPVEPPPPAAREPERLSVPPDWSRDAGRPRPGEPALASRMAQLEALLRRLIASPLYGVEEAEQAPAGPGVYLLSDSEQTTHYFVEACKTLRVGLGHMLRSERGGRREASVRSLLAKHLGISESRVSKYLKEHCAVRWLQLDEDASGLAHFAIAVLRPSLNE